MKLPGDKTKDQYLDEVIRVNHAGEYGAKRIYQGQMFILKKTQYNEKLKHMADQESVHLEYFEQEMKARKIRPSLLLPFWHCAGFLLGASTAILGIKSAMTCTEAVEEVIDKHYQEQINDLPESENKLKETIIKFRQEEIEHKEIASAFNNNSGKLHHFLNRIISTGCKISIELAKKI